MKKLLFLIYCLFFREGLAINAFAHFGIFFVCAYRYAIKTAIIAVVTMVFALIYSTFNRVICLTVIHVTVHPLPFYI